MSEYIIVKRLKDACCGMEVGKVYIAEIVKGSYVRVKLREGEWTSDHWMGDFFEVIE